MENFHILNYYLSNVVISVEIDKISFKLIFNDNKLISAENYSSKNKNIEQRHVSSKKLFSKGDCQ